MEAFLAMVGQGVTASLGWVGSVATAVQDTPMLMAGVVLGFVGLGIGLLSRLLHL
ncbi:hypothetical protein [uncultured Oscillibacter sp.]|uniref:hypothetical protein n=1 Tax=uncultured Oscillibacter sp. TaxID=876091 RepID=UPI0026004E5E|nr:hypothetical protein [uncultured Oscillibacter sp.]